MRCDIFCNVIDNFGDIGVAWRLARQLRVEYGWQLRLWVDDLASFARLERELQPASTQQWLDGVDIRHWPANMPAPDTMPALVIEAFGCTLPPSYVGAMAACPRPPLWLNLEYLSAEDWVESCHALPSPHPRLPLTKYFFFPGFSRATGGVICEHGLLGARDAWQACPQTQDAWWQTRGVPPRLPAEVRLSLFCYENPAIVSWLAALAASTHPVRLLVPHGRILPQLAQALGRPALAIGEVHQHGALSVHVLPFSDQAGYDRLLWSCDINIVRGEDSFMRAQWAARPFLWHIYPQDDSAHLVKLDAFLQRYCASLPAATAQALRDAQHAFNHQAGLDAAWPALLAQQTALGTHARQWADSLCQGGDLATRLVQFTQNRLQ